VIEELLSTSAITFYGLAIAGGCLWVLLFSVFNGPLEKLARKPRAKGVIILAVGFGLVALLFSSFSEAVERSSKLSVAPYVGIIIIGICVWIAMYSTLVLPLGGIIQRVCDFLWIPSKEKRIHKTDPGIRLEMVLTQSKEATAWWEGLTGIFLFVPLSIFLPIALVLGWNVVEAWIAAFSKGDPGSLVDYTPREWKFILLGFLALTFLGPPLYYHVRRFIQRNSRLVVFTDWMFALLGRPTLPAIFFRAIEDIYKSATPTALIDDVVITADPEEINPRYRTSMLRDWWTKRLFKVKDVISLLVPSRARGGADFLPWMEDGLRFENSRSRIRLRDGRIMSQIRTGESIEFQVLRQSYAERRDPDQAKALAEREKEINLDLLRAEAVEGDYDVYKVVDPGIWGPDGLEIGVPEVTPEEATLRQVEEEFTRSQSGHPSPAQSLEELQSESERIIREISQDWDSDTFYKRGRILKARLNKGEAIALCLRCGITLSDLARLLGKGMTPSEIEAIYLSEEFAASGSKVARQQAVPTTQDTLQKRPTTLRSTIADARSAQDQQEGEPGSGELPRRRPSPNPPGRNKPSQLRE